MKCTCQSVKPRRTQTSLSFLTFVLLSLSASHPATAFAQDEPPNPRKKVRIEPDARVQAAIVAIADSTSEQSLTDGLARLETLIDGDQARLVQQLLHYLAHADEPRAMQTIGLILDRSKVSAQPAVAALAPQLDNENAMILGAARELLRHYEDGSASRPPDFSAYRAFIESEVRAGREPSFTLVQFMHESEPGLALLTLMRGFQLREPQELRAILWAEHVVADMLWKRQHGFIPVGAVEPAAQEQLELLSRHERWWVRVYILEMLKRHPELRVETLLNTLQQDEHPQIRLQAEQLGEAAKAADEQSSTAQEAPDTQGGR